MVSLRKINPWAENKSTQDVASKAPSNDKTSQVAKVSLESNVAKPSSVTRAYTWLKDGLANIGYTLSQKLNRDARELYNAVKKFDIS